MSRTEALQQLIEKCLEIVGPMLPRMTIEALREELPRPSPRYAPFDDDDFDALEARMGRWLREKGCRMRQFSQLTQIELWPDGRFDRTISRPCSFTAHALALIALEQRATQEVRGE